MSLPSLVLVHGFTQTGRSWRRFQQSANTPTADTLTVDLPGHGTASEVSADLWSSAERLGIAGGRATYVGYSLGGRICLHLALAFPSLVERLVVIGAHGGLDDPAERAQRRQADESLARSIEEQGVAAFLESWLAQPL